MIYNIINHQIQVSNHWENNDWFETCVFIQDFFVKKNISRYAKFPMTFF